MDQESPLPLVQTPASTVDSSLVAFEQLPNLPKPLIPEINLGIEHIDVNQLALAITEGDGSISSQRRVGYFLADNFSQTEESDILDLKQTTHVIQTLVQDVGQLRKDLNFAKHVLRADYENRLNARASELYCQSAARCDELEKHHKEKIEIVRKSYKTQLNNAIQKIAGEYQAYYDEMLSGKTGRTEARIRELRQKIEIQELQLEQDAEKIAELTQKVEEYEEEFGRRDAEPKTPPPPLGISLEEAEALRAKLDSTEEELLQISAELAAKEDANKKLSRQLNSANRELEDERSKVSQLRRDMESQKRKAKDELEKAARMAESQRAALEKEWKDKAESAEKEAARKAEEEAELRRVKEQAKFQEEMNRQKHLEEQLRANQRRTPTPVDQGDLGAQVERLQQIEARQREEIHRLNAELERTKKVWEMKLAIMQRNFHALRDELFVRRTLQKQSAALHHASVGYASSNYKPVSSGRQLKPLPNIRAGSSRESSRTTKTSLGALGESPIPSAPSPTPQSSARNNQSPRMVTFDPPLQTY